MFVSFVFVLFRCRARLDRDCGRLPMCFFVFLLVFLGVVQDWTVIVEGFLLFPVCLAGFLLNIVRWPVTIPHQAASLTKT